MKTTLNLPLVLTRTLGRFRIHALDGGMLRLDGGAMFGVVPKPLWERHNPADERNRIPLAMRCLLVETPDALVLIDNGLGNKESEKFTELFGVENGPKAEGWRDGDNPEMAVGDGVRVDTGSDAIATAADPRGGFPTRLEQAIGAAGFSAEDVDFVIDTHLHFDHAGGNTRVDEEGEIRLSFPRARYFVQRGEWESALGRNERTRANYLPDNYEPLDAEGSLALVEGPHEIVPGVRLRPTPGHTPHHQSVMLESEDETALYLGDLVPTATHLPLPWIMGFDLEPMVTLETKRSLLRMARMEGWLLVFEHDPAVAWGRLDPSSERPALLAEDAG